MRPNSLRAARTLLACLVLSCLAGHAAPAASARRVVPNPVLYLQLLEPYQSGGKNYVRYRLGVMNSAEYPAEMFAAAPDLPPCGQNTKSSRTWVDIYDQQGKRLYGFCALGKPADLNTIWFSLEETVVPPSYVYIELNDRAANTKYKSNLSETTP
ncbi:MAG TPA: hypothetical protein VF621_05825 [Pyrinomonadaceae bacterium]|jgi:hypothetical protein